MVRRRDDSPCGMPVEGRAETMGKIFERCGVTCCGGMYEVLPVAVSAGREMRLLNMNDRPLSFRVSP